MLEREPKDFSKENFGSHPYQDPEPKTEQRQRAGIRPHLGEPLSHQGDQGAKWRFSLTSPTSMTSDEVVHH